MATMSKVTQQDAGCDRGGALIAFGNESRSPRLAAVRPEGGFAGVPPAAALLSALPPQPAGEEWPTPTLNN